MYFVVITKFCDIILLVMNLKQKLKKSVALSFLAVFVLVFILSFCITPYAPIYKSEGNASGDKMISLTFDDGPSDYTQKLLDGLRERNIHASFFVLGKKLDDKADILKQMNQDGHLIANHTYSHIDFLKSSQGTIRKELDETNEKIKLITGEDTLFYRPPYGHYLGTTLNCVDDMIAVSWSNDPADWKHMDYDYVYNYIINKAKDGAIILLHDTKETTVDAVLDAVDKLIDEGFTFARVDELLCRNGDSLSPAVAYHGCKKGKKPVRF